jgi:hypothetical protein
VAKEPDFYIAKDVITFDGGRAHNPGDPVPAENVKRNGWEDLVVRPGTKAAEQAVEETPA